MRHILTSVFLVVLLFPTLALGGEVKWKDLVYREGLFYKKSSDVPFKGKVTGKSQGTIKNGKFDGPWDRYHDNGKLKEKGIYRNGKEEGPWVRYHKNGQLSDKGTYKYGEKDGPWVRYYDNGQLHFKGTWKDRNPDGPWVSYNKDGTVNEKWTGTFKNGVKISD